MSNQLLLVTSAANGVKLWSYKSPSSTQIKSTEDGKYLAFTGSDGIISVYNTDNTRVDTITTDELREGIGEISTMCMAQRGRSQGIIRRWDRQDRRWLDQLSGHRAAITTHLASVSVSGHLLVDNLQKNMQQHYIIPTEQALNTVDYSKFRKPLLLCGGDDGAVHLVDTNRSQTPLKTFENAHNAPVKGVAFSPYNRYLMCSAGLDKRVVLYDAEKQGAIKTLTTDQPLTALSFKNDGVTIAAGTIQGKLLLFDLRSSSKPLASVWAHEPHSVKSTAFQLQVVGKKSGSSGTATSSSSTTSTSKRTSVANNPRSGDAIRHTNNNNNTYMDMFSPVKDSNGKESDQSDIIDDVDAGLVGGSSKMTRRATSPSNLRPTRDGSGTRLERELLRAARSRSEREGLPDAYSTTTTSSQSGLSREDSGGHPIGQTAITTTSARNAYQGTAPAPSTRSSSSAVYEERASSPLTRYARPRSQLVAETKIDHYVAYEIGGVLRDTTPPNSYHRRHRSTTSYSMPMSNDGSSSNSGATIATTGRARLPQLSIMARGLIEEEIHASGLKTAPPTGLTWPYNNEANHHDAVSATGTSLEATTGTPSAFQLRVVEGVIEDCLQDFREEIRADLQNLHLELLRQFHIQRNEIETLVRRYGEADQLRDEVERLQDENQRLRARLGDLYNSV
ncbi:WD40-repeat-containing domain protein [Syncephalis plumigaleata]|nr:WD40-repeat-containing domain protein [Syncephalis plumigaleata]